MTRKCTGIMKLTSKSQSRAMPSAALNMNVKPTPQDAAVRRKSPNGDLQRISRSDRNTRTGIKKNEMKSREHRIRPPRVRLEKGEHVDSDPDFNPADELFEGIIAQVEEEGRADDARCQQDQRLDPPLTPDLIEENEGGREKDDGAKM